jgi:hypothetical protein
MRYYTGKGPNYDLIKDQALEIVKKQNEFNDIQPKVLFKNGVDHS